MDRGGLACMTYLLVASSNSKTRLSPCLSIARASTISCACPWERKLLSMATSRPPRDLILSHRPTRPRTLMISLSRASEMLSLPRLSLLR